MASPPAVVHRLVGPPPQQLIAAMDQREWSLHTPLGALVQSVVAVFAREPPAINLNIFPPPPSSFGGGGASPAPLRVVMPAPRPAPPPPVAATPVARGPELSGELVELNTLTDEELTELTQNQDRLAAFCASLPAVKRLAEQELALSAHNVALARENLEQEPVLQAGCARLADLHSAVLAQQTALDTAVRRHEELARQLAPGVLVNRLLAAAAEADTAAEAVMARARSGAEPVSDELLNRFIAAKTVRVPRSWPSFYITRTSILT